MEVKDLALFQKKGGGGLKKIESFVLNKTVWLEKLKLMLKHTLVL